MVGGISYGPPGLTTSGGEQFYPVGYNSAALGYGTKSGFLDCGPVDLQVELV
jgi:hypothetical protein